MSNILKIHNISYLKLFKFQPVFKGRQQNILLIFCLPIQSSNEFHIFLTYFKLLLVTAMRDIKF